METQKKIWLMAGGGWFCLLCLFLLLNEMEKPTFLALPAKPSQISIQTGERELNLKRKGKDWFLGETKVRPSRMAEILQKLQTCQNPYPKEKVPTPKNPRPVVIKMDNKSYLLDGYNAFHHSHYLNDGEKSWFCDQSLKAILVQPQESWIEH